MTRPLLSSHFIPAEYILKQESSGLIQLTILGRRIGKPSKRITLHQKKLKVKSAHITSDNKNKTFEYDVKRINHLPSRQEVRLHTTNLQYPGNYRLELLYKGPTIDEIKEFIAQDNHREMRLYLPSVDEDSVGASVKLAS